MNPLDLIQHNYESFTKTEKAIAISILNQPKDFARSSISATVDELDISKAALIRFSKKLGYSGYVEFKYDLSRFLVSQSFSKPEDITASNPIQLITKQYCEYIEQMNDVVNLDTVIAIAKHIIAARRVKIMALNRTALGAMQLQMRCLKIGIDVDVVTDTVAMMDVSFILGKEDYTLIFSIKDNGKRYGDIVDTLNNSGCKVGLVTMTPQLSFAKNCEHVISLPSVSRGYASFIDEQALYFVFVEVLLNQLALMTSQQK